MQLDFVLSLSLSRNNDVIYINIVIKLIVMVVI